MKKTVRIVLSAILMIILVVAMNITAFAGDATVRYEGGAEKFVFLPGSEYTDTDLFDNFKGVMPGDTLTQDVTVENSYKGSDYVKIYMRAELHDEDANPLSPGVAETGETVASMSDFLSQLSMTVKQGDKVLFDASPDELDGLKNNVLIGTLKYGETADLKVELNVPIEMDSKYADRVGEVDWVFAVEELNNPPKDKDKVIPGSPKTGDESNIMLWGTVGIVAVCGIVIIVARRRKSRR